MNALEIRGLTWQYSGAPEPALKNVDLDVPEGAFVGVIGANEAGKSTLVSAIRGLIPRQFNGVFSGSIKAFGTEIKEMGPAQLAQTIGFVFADPESQFTAMSVEEELAFGMENIGLTVPEIAERITWAADLTGISHLLEKSPYDISGGQKQRVAIASILAMHPKIVILDEPTSMLDPFGKDMVFDVLLKMKQELNMTIIVVEHDLERLARLSDMMVLVTGGTIERATSPAELFEEIGLLTERGLNPPPAMRLMDALRRRGLYTGPIYSDTEVATAVLRSVLTAKRGA